MATTHLYCVRCAPHAAGAPTDLCVRCLEQTARLDAHEAREAAIRSAAARKEREAAERAATPKLTVHAPATPGAELTVVARCETLEQARAVAERFCEGRADLRHHDVEIRLGWSGRRIEFAGPAR